MITEETHTVELVTKYGPIFGYVDKRDEGTYYRFKRIPYAKPPVGPLRFLPPSPIPPWTERLDCTKEAELPFHVNLHQRISGSEDCLYIEVMSPNIKPDHPLPVMFWIGSLGFKSVCDVMLDPTLLVNEEVVFVRCGYRLGPFGFLSVNNVTAPGNNGLKDIVLALKWIQTNIELFGGDKNNITLFGNSSGGAAVHFMMLSPMATGLFHKAIIQSTSTLYYCAIGKNPSNSAMDLAKSLGIVKSCQIETVEELRAVPALKIMEAFFHMLEKQKATENDIFNVVFKPCIEEEFEGQTPFITKSPYAIIKSGNFNKVPLIIGCNNIEAAVMQYTKKDFYEDYDKFNKNPNLLVPKHLVGNTKFSKNIGHQLIKFYLGGEELLREDTKNQYLQLISDYYFLYYIHKTVRLHKEFAPDHPIYYYIMTYTGDWIVPQRFNFFNSVGHAAELPLMFRIQLPNSPVCNGSRDSITTRKRVVKMWTNFAKFGNPTPVEGDPLLHVTWDPVEDNKINYLSIGSELTKGRNPFQERMTFWDELHKEHTFLRIISYFDDLGVSF